MNNGSRKPLADRLWSKVDRNGPIMRPDLGPCWVWTGHVNAISGHGQIGLGGRGEGGDGVHRVAFFLAEGRWPVPSALHHCDNPPCVKNVADDLGPSHLYEGTQADNIRDMVKRGRTSRKLCDEDLVRARALLADGVMQAEIARLLGVSRGTICMLANGKTWKG